MSGVLWSLATPAEQVAWLHATREALPAIVALPLAVFLDMSDEG